MELTQSELNSIKTRERNEGFIDGLLSSFSLGIIDADQVTEAVMHFDVDADWLLECAHDWDIMRIDELEEVLREMIDF